MTRLTAVCSVTPNTLRMSVLLCLNWFVYHLQILPGTLGYVFEKIIGCYAHLVMILSVITHLHFDNGVYCNSQYSLYVIIIMFKLVCIPSSDPTGYFRLCFRKNNWMLRTPDDYLVCDNTSPCWQRCVL